MITLQAIHRRLLKLERRNSEAELTPARIAAALWHAEETGELPEQPALAEDVNQFRGALEAIEVVQKGIPIEECSDVSQDAES